MDIIKDSGETKWTLSQTAGRQGPGPHYSKQQGGKFRNVKLLERKSCLRHRKWYLLQTSSRTGRSKQIQKTLYCI